MCQRGCQVSEGCGGRGMTQKILESSSVVRRPVTRRLDWEGHEVQQLLHPNCLALLCFMSIGLSVCELFMVTKPGGCGRSWCPVEYRVLFLPQRRVVGEVFSSRSCCCSSWSPAECILSFFSASLSAGLSTRLVVVGEVLSRCRFSSSR